MITASPREVTLLLEAWSGGAQPPFRHPPILYPKPAGPGSGSPSAKALIEEREVGI
jgi:hypothetical protein